MTRVLFSLSAVQVTVVSTEKLSERVARLLDAGVAAGRFTSPTHGLKLARISSGWPGELRKREREYERGERKDPPTMRGDKAAALAEVLEISVDELLGGPPVAGASETARRWAIEAARNLQLSERAIAEVEKRPLTPGLSRLQWFREIETADGVESGPAARVHSELSELPRDSQRGR